MTPILIAAGVRAAVISLSAIVLGLWLAQTGSSAVHIGITVAAGMCANAISAGLVAWAGERALQRSVLIAAALLSGLGLILLTITRNPMLVTAAAFIGMINGMGRDRGGAQALEQTLLAKVALPAQRTRAFVHYTVVQDAGGAIGALAAGLAPRLDRITASGYSALLIAAGALMLLSALLYLRLPTAQTITARKPISPQSRKRVAGLSGLFALDSIGGGFLAGTLIAYWFFERFALPASTIGAMFFTGRVLNALSYFAAEQLARRIGLLRTIVYTHLPTSLILFLLPFLPTAAWAITLYLVRESLVQMDVPTRQSYVAAVVQPHELASAMGVTNLVRYAGWALGPALAGFAMTRFGLDSPLFFAGVLKAEAVPGLTS